MALGVYYLGERRRGFILMGLAGIWLAFGGKGLVLIVSNAAYLKKQVVGRLGYHLDFGQFGFF